MSNDQSNEPSKSRQLVTLDPWTALRQHTPARIALGRAGASQPTAALLAFAMAHAQARDAVHEPLQVADLIAQLATYGLPAITVHSRAPDREAYLRRPDWGRRLDQASCERLRAGPHADVSTGGHVGADLAFVVADGLSPIAVLRHAVPVIIAARPQLDGLTIAPVVIAEQSRVALGDEVGALLGARLVLMLIGERPGLSSPDSLGIYLTWAPQVGCTDAQRNCISNIRPQGLSYQAAAGKLADLVRGAIRLSLTGVALKDERQTEPFTPSIE